MKIKKSGICGSPDFLPFNLSNYYFVSTNYSIFSFLLQYVIILLPFPPKEVKNVQEMDTTDNGFSLACYFSICSKSDMVSHYHKFSG